VRLGPAIEENVKKAVELLSGPASETISQILQESYRAGETYGGAFGKLFAQLFAEQGLILLDPLDARLHRIAAPLYKKAIEHRDELNEKLLERGKELESAGYDVQVKVTAKSTLLFTIRDDVRQPVVASNSHFTSGGATWTREEVLRLADSSPETFSANALFRPVVQDYLLPTAAYLGGPAEIAYFAQSSVIYEHVLGRMPVILPRAGFTILDAKAEKREPLGRSAGIATQDGVCLGADRARGQLRSGQGAGGEHVSGARCTDREAGPDAERGGEHGAQQDWISVGKAAPEDGPVAGSENRIAGGA
jgi:uncharacterized protein YllA (UPF0747 family)